MSECARPFFALCIGAPDGDKDAKNLFKRLLYSFPFDDIRLLINDDVTKTNIISNLEELSTKAVDNRKNNPVLFFYYAGHGKEIKYTGHRMNIKSDQHVKIALDLNSKKDSLINITDDLLLNTKFKECYNSEGDAEESKRVTIFFCFEMCYCGKIDIEKIPFTTSDFAIIYPNKNEITDKILTESLLESWTFNPQPDDKRSHFKEISIGDLSKKVTELVNKKNKILGYNHEFSNSSSTLPKLTREATMPPPSGIGDWNYVWTVPLPKPFISYKAYEDLCELFNNKTQEYRNQYGKVLVVCGEGPVGKSTAVKKALEENNKSKHSIWINCVPQMGIHSIVASILHGISKQYQNSIDFIHNFFKEHRNEIKSFKPTMDSSLIRDLIKEIRNPPIEPVTIVLEDVDNLQQSMELEYVRYLIIEFCKRDCESRIILIQQDTNDPCIPIAADHFNVIQIVPLSRKEIKNCDEISVLGNYDRYGPQKPVILNILKWLIENPEKPDLDKYSFKKSSADEMVTDLVEKELNGTLTLATCVAYLYKNRLSKNEKDLVEHIAILSSITDKNTGKPLLAGPIPYKLISNNNDTDTIVAYKGLKQKALITGDDIENDTEDEKINSKAVLFMHHSIAQRITDEIQQIPERQEREKEWHKKAAEYYRESIRDGMKKLCILYRLKVHSVAAENYEDLSEMLSERSTLEAIVAYGYFDIIENWARELIGKVKSNDRQMADLKICLRMAAMFNGDPNNYNELIKRNEQYTTTSMYVIAQNSLIKAEYALLLNDYKEALRIISDVNSDYRSGRQYEDFATRVWLGYGYPMQALDLIKKHAKGKKGDKNSWWRDYLKGSCYAQLSDHQQAVNSYKTFLRNLLPEHQDDLDAQVRTLIMTCKIFAEESRFGSRLINQPGDQNKLFRAMICWFYADKLLGLRPVEDYYWKAKSYLALAQLLSEMNENTIRRCLQITGNSQNLQSFKVDNFIYKGLKALGSAINENSITKNFNEFKWLMKKVIESDKWDFNPFVFIKDLFDNYEPEYNSKIWSIDEETKYPFLEVDLILFLAQYYTDLYCKNNRKTEKDKDRAAKLVYIAIALSKAWSYQNGLGYALEIAGLLANDDDKEIGKKIDFYENALFSAVRTDAINLIVYRAILYMGVAEKIKKDQPAVAAIVDVVDNAISHGLFHKYLSETEANTIFKRIEELSTIADWENKLRTGTDYAKRRNVRTPVFANVRIWKEKSIASKKEFEDMGFGRVIDLSYSGCKIICKQKIETDDRLKIRFEELEDGKVLDLFGVRAREWDDIIPGPAVFGDKEIFKESNFKNYGFEMELLSSLLQNLNRKIKKSWKSNLTLRGFL